MYDLQVTREIIVVCKDLALFFLRLVGYKFLDVVTNQLSNVNWWCLVS